MLNTYLKDTCPAARVQSLHCHDYSALFYCTVFAWQVFSSTTTTLIGQHGKKWGDTGRGQEAGASGVQGPGVQDTWHKTILHA